MSKKNVFTLPCGTVMVLDFVNSPKPGAEYHKIGPSCNECREKGDIRKTFCWEKILSHITPEDLASSNKPPEPKIIFSAEDDENAENGKPNETPPANPPPAPSSETQDRVKFLSSCQKICSNCDSKEKISHRRGHKLEGEGEEKVKIPFFQCLRCGKTTYLPPEKPTPVDQTK